MLFPFYKDDSNVQLPLALAPFIKEGIPTSLDHIITTCLGTTQ